MSQKTHRIKMIDSTAPAEEVGAITMDFLKKNRLLDKYEVTELKKVDKPADLEKSTAKAPKAE